jgi:hypothetical protein
MTLHKFAELHQKWFSVCSNTMSASYTIATFESRDKENNDLNKFVGFPMTFTVRNFICRSASVHELYP